jgi:hypothetical protein
MGSTRMIRNRKLRLALATWVCAYERGVPVPLDVDVALAVQVNSARHDNPHGKCLTCMAANLIYLYAPGQPTKRAEQIKARVEAVREALRDSGGSGKGVAEASLAATPEATDPPIRVTPARKAKTRMSEGER